MRIVLAICAFATVFAFDAGQGARAQWCAYYDAYTYTCGFRTFRQCLATISGVGGSCRPDYRARETPRHSRRRSDRD